MDTCKNGCKLQGERIPEDYLRAGYYGKWDGVTPRYYSRLIGVETMDYDGVSEWLCPDCGVRWDRWAGEVLEEAAPVTQPERSADEAERSPEPTEDVVAAAREANAREGLGLQGEFYPCKPDIFAATYEPVDE